MKKIEKSIVVLFAVILAVAVVMIAYLFQKNKETVAERTESRAVQKKDDSNDILNGGGDRSLTEDENSRIGDNILMIGAIKLEMLSADILDGDSISIETKYPVDNFQSKTVPERQATIEMIDWDSIFREAPEYEKYHLADYGEYTEEEEDEIEKKYKSVIDKYTYVVNKPQKLYFIKCKLTNLSDNVIEDVLPFDVSTKSLNTGEVEYDADICYFDKAIYTEGEERDMKYYFFRLEGNESMECTIGLAVPQGENEKYYYGEPITGDTPYDPEMFPDFVDIDTLPLKE